MTAAQEESWADDANQYVAEEDIDAFGARSSCELLLTELQVRALLRAVLPMHDESYMVRFVSQCSWLYAVRLALPCRRCVCSRSSGTPWPPP